MNKNRDKKKTVVGKGLMIVFICIWENQSLVCLKYVFQKLKNKKKTNNKQKHYISLYGISDFASPCGRKIHVSLIIIQTGLITD